VSARLPTMRLQYTYRYVCRALQHGAVLLRRPCPTACRLRSLQRRLGWYTGGQLVGRQASKPNLLAQYTAGDAAAVQQLHELVNNESRAWFGDYRSTGKDCLIAFCAADKAVCMLCMSSCVAV
jgi:hypothetical protein